MTDLAPENLAAVAALSSLRDAYPRLRDVIEGEAYGARQARKPVVRLSPAALAAQDQLVRAEREGRAYSARAGIKLSAPGSRAPVRPALVDAQEHAHMVVIDQCWIASSSLERRHPMLSWGPPRLSDEAAGYRADPWHLAVSYLAVAAHLLTPTYAAALAKALTPVDRQIRNAAGLADIRIPLPGHPDCPACGRAALRIDITSPNDRDWTVTCRPDCLCTGSQCACGRPGRTPGQRHMWPAAQFGARYGTIRTLRRLADAQARARRAA